MKKRRGRYEPETRIEIYGMEGKVVRGGWTFFAQLSTPRDVQHLFFKNGAHNSDVSLKIVEPPEKRKTPASRRIVLLLRDLSIPPTFTFFFSPFTWTYTPVERAFFLFWDFKPGDTARNLGRTAFTSPVPFTGQTKKCQAGQSPPSSELNSVLVLCSKACNKRQKDQVFQSLDGLQKKTVKQPKKKLFSVLRKSLKFLWGSRNKWYFLSNSVK